METRTHTKKTVDFKKVDTSPQAPWESFGSRNGNMASEACYWLAFQNDLR